MRTLKADDLGLSLFVDRLAKEMTSEQIYRELVQNGIEAGAGHIKIDGWTDPDTGHTLTRVSDNGSGMTHAQLVKYLSTLHVQSKGGANYGVGARIASLPQNPAGVTFASRTKHGEGLVRLIKARSGKYGIKEWAVDVDGYEQLEEVVTANEGELDHVGSTGTAVILHGNGKVDTWTGSASYKAHKFLAERYYEFPEGVRIQVQEPGSGRLKTVKPFGQFLADKATADGEIPFKNVAGLNGVMFWWVLPRFTEMNAKAAARDVHHGGVGAVVEDEIFDYGTWYSSDFGLIYGSVAKRVAILIWIDEATMDTGRSSIVLPTTRKHVPWKQLGAYFAAHMPPEIDSLLTRVTVSDASLDAELAKMLDPEWMKKLDPVQVPAPAQDGPAEIGDETGDAVPSGDDLPPDKGPNDNPPNPKPREAARKAGGNNPSATKPKVVTPKVEFLEPEEMADGHEHITYVPSANVVQVSTQFAPYVREIGRWMEATGHPEALVRLAVQKAYMAEYAATIIDANGQGKHGVEPQVIDDLKSDPALYAKALGFQSLSQRIETFLKDVAKQA
jgi:hypothetical protein